MTDLSGTAAKLAAYYREHGDTDHVRAVEAALGDDWCSTVELADASGRSRNYTGNVLHYLHDDGRADRRQGPLARPVRRQTWQWEWRLPQASG